MIVVVTYDVVDDGRQQRLYRALLGYGAPVQRSVFECDLTTAELGRLRRRVERIAKETEDDVRLYILCEACVARVETLGGSPPDRRPSYYVV